MKPLIFLLSIVISGFVVAQDNKNVDYKEVLKYLNSSYEDRINYLDSFFVMNTLNYDLVMSDLKQLTGIDLREKKVFGLSSITNFYYVSNQKELDKWQEVMRRKLKCLKKIKK